MGSHFYFLQKCISCLQFLGIIFQGAVWSPKEYIYQISCFYEVVLVGFELAANCMDDHIDFLQKLTSCSRMFEGHSKPKYTKFQVFMRLF